MFLRAGVREGGKREEEGEGGERKRVREGRRGGGREEEGEGV